MSEPCFVVVTAARDEADHIGYTLASVAGQTLAPAQWVIVDDGSTDDTAALALAAARSRPWITVVRRQPGGGRDTGAGVVAAITQGLAQVKVPDYAYLFNLDADILLGPRYFAGILEKFAQNPRLGAAAGELYDLEDGRPRRTRSQRFAMVGALKGWRRECFEEVGGLAPGEGWEAIDSLRAMMRGWQAATFAEPHLWALHLKPRHRGWLRHGRALYFAGAHPWWVLASACYHLKSRPRLRAAGEILTGYLAARLSGAPRYQDPEFAAFQRRFHLQRLTGFWRGGS
jgi:glycosyltransferase involved in cell wall biosynthesis